MSLDCYPLTQGRKIGLREQPLALDVAYEEDLLVTVVDGCQTVVVHSLAGGGDLEVPEAAPLGRFSLGQGVVIERVAYCKTGDYIVCVGHQNGSPTLYVAFEWRANDQSSGQAQVVIEELNLSASTTPIDELDRSNKLEDVDVCQRTGNLAASYGDLVVIYKFTGGEEPTQLGDINETKDSINQLQRFTHIISVKLTIWAHSISLVENYLSLSTSDHVQVLKLELLTLQIQSDGQNDFGDVASCSQAQNQANRSSSGSSGGGGGANQGRNAGASKSQAAAASRNRRRALMGSAGEEANGGVVGASTTTGSSCCGNDTDSLMSDTDNSTATNFSAFNTTAASTTTTTEEAGETSGADHLNCAVGQQQQTSECSDNELDAAGGGDAANQSAGEQQLNNDSDMSIITMNNVNNQLGGASQQQQAAAAAASRVENSQDDCITWNLNTKKLVKLPTLMHNTSSDLSSYHICHPLELLGPASESIACRVLARLYAQDFCQNQLEPVVLLCKQFDCERAPVKSTHLQPIYLTESLDDQRRLVAGGGSKSLNVADSANLASETVSRDAEQLSPPLLLKSLEHELLASITCFVATLANCFVYALHGKKVTRLQTITHPDLCLDLRPDLLNVHLLTPLGLQICSTGLCDATFRYDWSSSADLNLSFVACNRARVLATAKHIVLVSSSPPDVKSGGQRANANEENCCFIEVWRKPSLVDLFERVVHTIKRCQSISIRSNLLTYLHASAQLSLITSNTAPALRRDGNEIANEGQQSPMEMLRGIAIMLCKQLLQKKQTNVITNSRIDRAIKHLLDISHCDLKELMARHMAQLEEAAAVAGASAIAALRSSRLKQRAASMGLESYENDRVEFEETLEDQDGDEDDDDEEQLDCDYELLTIYLRHSKFNPTILTYLQANATHEPTCTRVIAYMFNHNPRLLIKCAQRFVGTNSNQALPQDQMVCINLLITRLKQLAEFDSTGINRATVLFTLANLYSAIEGARDQNQDHEDDGTQRLSLTTLSQIKPLSHLAITMCSNHEIIGRPMARLVAQNYPEVFKLFLNQLAKREAKVAWREFAKVQAEVEVEADAQLSSTASHAVDGGQQDLVMTNRGATLRLFGSDGPAAGELDNQFEWDEDEQFERRLRLVAELEPVQLADLFLSQKAKKASLETAGSSPQLESDENQQDCGEDDETIEAYLRASICLQESQLILARLCESSR